MDVPLALRECLEYVIGALITHRDHVSITQSQQGNRLIFDLRLHPEDTRRLTSHNGHVVRALRNLLAAAAIRENLRVALQVEPLEDVSAGA